MNVKIKRLHKDAVIPTYAHFGDAGMDLTATSRWSDGTNICYGTGIAIEIPYGHVGLVFSRSSVCNKDLLLSNAVGVIDACYRGEISMKFKATDLNADVYDVGDRIGQIVILPYPDIVFEEVEELSDSERGVGGYGSSGR